MAAFTHGSVTVGVSPKLVCTIAPNTNSAVLQNAGDADVFLGGPDVSSSGERRGLLLSAGADLTLQVVDFDANDLYGVVAGPQSTIVVFLI